MTEIKLYIDKTLEQNASLYFEKAKKCKKKITGALETLEKNAKKLQELEQRKVKQKPKPVKPKQKKQWYEKFHWFHSSEGFLCVGGRDATTNDIVIKKYAEKDDLVFHTDMAGSPFFVVKKDSQPDKKITNATLEETAQATASYNSRAWKAGLATIDVFYVKPEQVTKQAPAGEFLGKGAFMIRGKTTYLHPILELAIGIKDNKIIGGPVEAIKAHAEQYVVIVQGREKASSVAKKIMAKFKADVELDDIIRFLPAGGCDVKNPPK